MNIDYLRNFITIVDCGTILKASKILYIAQPSLSNQIKELEKFYSCKLIERGGRNVSLTNQGKIVYERAKQIISLYDSCLIEVKEYNSTKKGTLRIALPPTIYRDLIHFHFSKFIERYPDTRLDVHEIVSTEAEKLLDNGIVELAIVNPSFNKELYNYKELIKESFKVVLPESSSLLTKETISLKDLDSLSLATPRAYVNLLLDQARNKKVNLIIDTITSSTSGAIEIAKEKNIIAVVPLPSQENIGDSNYFRPLVLSHYNEFSRNIIWLKGKNLSPIAESFISLCDEIKN